MSIQNIGTSSAAPAQPLTRPASDGEPAVVSSVHAPPAAAVQSQQQAAATQQVASQQQVSSEQLKNAVEAINQALRQSNHGLEFSVDGDTKEPVVKVVDKDTGDVIRQIPSEETLAISRSIGQYLNSRQGLLLRQKA